MDVSSIPIRSNGQTILASWFNTIRTLLANLDAYSDQNSATIGNGVGPAEDITDMTVITANYTSAIWEVELYRHTDSVQSFANGRVNAQLVNGVWRVDSGGFIGDADSAPGGGGITFSIVESTGVAQVQYVSNTIAGGTYVGNIKFRRLTFNV